MDVWELLYFFKLKIVKKLPDKLSYSYNKVSYALKELIFSQ